jgi:CAAX protease family protein
MDREEIESEESESQIPESMVLTIWHCIGLMMLYAILQFWLDLLLTNTGYPALKEVTWIKVTLQSGISGVLTAAAGAVLAGFTLDDLLAMSEFTALSVLSAIAIGFGLSVVSGQAANWLQSVWPLSKEYLEDMAKLHGQNYWNELLAVSVVAPIVEETIFRGVMFEGLRVHQRAGIAALVSSILFGLLHPYPWPTILAFLLGLFLCWVKLLTGSLPVCMIIHSLHNGIPTMLLHWGQHQITGYNDEGTVVQYEPIWFFVLGLIALAAGTAGIYYGGNTTRIVTSDQPAETTP